MIKYPAYLLFIPLIFSILAGGCTEKHGSPRGIQSLPEVFSPATYGELKKVFASRDYDWNTIEQGVPHLILERLPADLDSISRLTEKKRVFFLSLLPMVLMANEEILEEREILEQIFRLHDADFPLDFDQTAAVVSLSREYGLGEDPLTSIAARRKLMRRVDIIPPSMALAQAATESAYGTSRFALQGNNLFGEWTFAPGTGLVPRERPADETYEVRRFETLYDSVQSYMRNLNTHRAYRAFREHRAHLRAAGLPLRGTALARGLENYSSRKEAYVEDIRAIIRLNHLSILSSATLRKNISSVHSPAFSPSGSGSGLLAPLVRSSRVRPVRENP
jgi:Bax protein